MDKKIKSHDKKVRSHEEEVRKSNNMSQITFHESHDTNHMSGRS